jgi:hypothetical protein
MLDCQHAYEPYHCGAGYLQLGNLRDQSERSCQRRLEHQSLGSLYLNLSALGLNLDCGLPHIIERLHEC